MSKCKHKVPCGCKDTGITTANSCESGTVDCPTPDACAETFCNACIIHCGDTIVDLGIQQGDRMDAILQMLTLYLTNPGCITPDNTGGVVDVVITAAGIGYSVAQSFLNVPLIGGSGAGAEATVVTGAAGEVIDVTITTPGSGYTEGDLVTPDTTVIGSPTIAAALTVSIASCKSVIGLKSIAISTTAIDLSWLTEPGATEYEVEYKLATGTTWTSNGVVEQHAFPTDKICGLVSDTAYHIRVKSTCPNGACYSVTILVKTI